VLPKKHLSYSQINTYLQCPAQYYFQYMEGIPQPKNPGLIRGTAVHSGLEHNFAQKIESRKDLPIHEAMEWAVSTFEMEAEEVEFKKQTKEETKDSVATLMGLAMRELAPEYQPIAVEDTITLEFENMPYTYIAKLDLIDEEGHIVDFKTSGRTPADNIVRDNLQLAGYALAYRMEYGQQEASISLDYLVNLKKVKRKKIQAYATNAQLDRFLAILSIVAENIEQGIFYPNPTFQYCGNCPFRKECHDRW